MKKTILLAGTACLISLNVNAAEFKPYIGMDIGVAKMDLANGMDTLIEDTYSTISLNLGAKLHKNFGMEVFYQASSEEEGDTVQNLITGAVGQLDSSFYAFGVDAIGYYPINDKLELLGSIGLGQYESETKGVGLSAKADGMGYRFAIGAEYQINDKWSARTLARYVNTDIDGLDNITEITIGAKYSF